MTEIKSRKSPRLGSQEGEMVPAERVQSPKGWEGPGECRGGRHKGRWKRGNQQEGCHSS